MRLVDRIAYINHDIDDAVRAGILRIRGPAPAPRSSCSGATGSERIETLVRDLLERSGDAGDIVQGEEVGGAMLRLRTFMFDSSTSAPARSARSRASSACCARSSSTTPPSRRRRSPTDAGPSSAWSTGWPG